MVHMSPGGVNALANLALGDRGRLVVTGDTAKIYVPESEAGGWVGNCGSTADLLGAMLGVRYLEVIPLKPGAHVPGQPDEG